LSKYFVEELKIYFTEKALLIIPVLIKNAVTDELADALQSTSEFYNRTYQTFGRFFLIPLAKNISCYNEAMYGLITRKNSINLSNNK
jgi:hypothetical protein